MTVSAYNADITIRKIIAFENRWIKTLRGERIHLRRWVNLPVQPYSILELIGDYAVVYINYTEDEDDIFSPVHQMVLSNMVEKMPPTGNPNLRPYMNTYLSWIASTDDFVGNWDASSTAFPTTGGSGESGAILQGDVFLITVAGTIQSLELDENVIIRAKVDNPGQDWKDWYVNEIGIDSAQSVTEHKLEVVNKLIYQDIFDFGLEVENAIRLNGDTINPGAKEDDIVITEKTGTNTPLSLQNSVLYTVNGKVVFPDYVGNDAYLRKTMGRLHNGYGPQISVIDFRELGGFTKEIINKGFATFIRENDFTVTMDYDLQTMVIDEGTLFLVIRGHLYPLDKGYTVVNERKLRFTIDKRLAISTMEKFPYCKDWIVAVGQNQQGYDLRTANWVNYVGNNESAIIKVVNPLIGVHGFFDQTNRYLPEYAQGIGFDNATLLNRAPQGLFYHSDGSLGHYKITHYTKKRVAMAIDTPRSQDQLLNTVPMNAVTVFSHVKGIKQRRPLSPGYFIDYYTL